MEPDEFGLFPEEESGANVMPNVEDYIKNSPPTGSFSDLDTMKKYLESLIKPPPATGGSAGATLSGTVGPPLNWFEVLYTDAINKQIAADNARQKMMYNKIVEKIGQWNNYSQAYNAAAGGGYGAEGAQTANVGRLSDTKGASWMGMPQTMPPVYDARKEKNYMPLPKLDWNRVQMHENMSRPQPPERDKEKQNEVTIGLPDPAAPNELKYYIFGKDKNPADMKALSGYLAQTVNKQLASHKMDMGNTANLTSTRPKYTIRLQDGGTTKDETADLTKAFGSQGGDVYQALKYNFWNQIMKSPKTYFGNNWNTIKNMLNNWDTKNDKYASANNMWIDSNSFMDETNGQRSFSPASQRATLRSNIIDAIEATVRNFYKIPENKAAYLQPKDYKNYKWTDQKPDIFNDGEITRQAMVVFAGMLKHIDSTTKVLIDDFPVVPK